MDESYNGEWTGDLQVWVDVEIEGGWKHDKEDCYQGEDKGYSQCVAMLPNSCSILGQAAKSTNQDYTQSYKHGSHCHLRENNWNSSVQENHVCKICR